VLLEALQAYWQKWKLTHRLTQTWQP